MTTVVDKLHGEFRDIVEILDKNAEPSFRSTLDGNFRKALLLCAASHFESRISSDVILFCEEISGQSSLIPSLVKNKAVARQYHTWFAWDRSNANAFLSMFGDKFKRYAADIIEKDVDLSAAVSSFLELGRERNRLVHQDYGSFFLEKTTDEIFELYRSALRFVEFVPTALRAFSKLETESKNEKL